MRACADKTNKEDKKELNLYSVTLDKHTEIGDLEIALVVETSPYKAKKKTLDFIKYSLYIMV